MSAESIPLRYIRSLTTSKLLAVLLMFSALITSEVRARAQANSEALTSIDAEDGRIQAVANEPGADQEPATVAANEAPQTAPSAFNSQEYVISPDDVLDIIVLDVKELSRVYRVSPNGSVTFPLLAQPLTAAGLRLDSFATEIESKLREAGLVTNPHVSIAVKQSRSHSIDVTGAVRKAMAYPVFGRTTLLNVLSEAGGPTEGAGGIVRVTRGKIAMQADHGAKQSVAIDLKRLLETGDPNLNIAVFPGDTVTVAPGGVIYVVGAVKKPGGFVLSTERQDITVLQALALAEDTTPSARRGKAMIVRRDTQAPGGREQIPVDLGKIADGKVADVALRPSDILFVPDSGSKKAFDHGAEAALQIVTGMATWGRF